MSRRISLLISLLFLCLTLSGCTGGQEIESCLFVIAMAVDAAPEGNLTVTVKALSGTEDGASGASGGEGASDSEAELEKTEPGYIVLSATAPSCQPLREPMPLTQSVSTATSAPEELQMGEEMDSSM